MCSLAYSQQTKKVEKGRISGATKNWVDTLAVQNAQTWTKETSGLLEREIEPTKYIVGPGDVFSISIISSEVFQFDAEVSPEGNLLIKSIGVINLKDKNLTDAKKLILAKIHNNLKVADAEITLKKLKQFKVTISGAIPKPLTVSATSADRVSEVIERAGGLQFESSERNIQIVRKGVEKKLKADLFKYFMLGDEEANPFVMGGDLVIVLPASFKESIEIQGEVFAPGEFEFAEGDSLSTLIRFGQGFLGSALLDSVKIARFTEAGNELVVDNLNLKSWKNKLLNNEPLLGDFPLRPGDRVYVRKASNWQNTDYVVIEGEVKYPGKYAIIEDQTKLRDILEKAGGFTEKASIDRIEFIRQKDALEKDPQIERLSRMAVTDMSQSEVRYYRAKVNEKKGAMSIDFREVMNNPNSENNVPLINQDSIIVPLVKDYVNVQGRVNNPGNIKYRKGLSYLDYIQLAGGFAFRADEGETFITKPQGGQFLADDMEKYAIEPGDVILVPTEAEYTFMETFTTALTIISQLVTIAGVVFAVTNAAR
ncbi:MAG TPA: SLBB domain-containing protein [Candidatus Kapabacteria bacterium]|nr:SLBB domain-containing protein [Candidatus Kapabacteria bacterium]